jgi:glutaredoxin-like protein
MQSRMLNAEITAQIKQIFTAELDKPVELIYFYGKDDCETCDEAKQLLEEMVSISDKLTLSVYDLAGHSQLATQYNIHHVPALVLAGRNDDKLTDYGIRFYGIPSGYEFGSLIQSIQIVSKRDSGLKLAVRNELKNLKKPLQLKVFVTPT